MQRLSMKNKVSMWNGFWLIKMSSPIKYVYNRLPACVSPEKRLVRSYATNARAALVQIFFVPATTLPPVEPWL